MRPNIQLVVRKRLSSYQSDAFYQEIVAVVRQEEGTGIVCVQCRADAEKLSFFMDQAGLHAAHYHAGMDETERETAYRKWMTGEARVVCCTIAFGMGIDKPNVRYVVHGTLPLSIEQYYQEYGRAGRDGAASRCIVLFHPEDHSKLRRMFGKEMCGRDLRNLDKMAEYCQEPWLCRHCMVAEMLSDDMSEIQECNTSCDNCMSDRTTIVHRNMDAYVGSVVSLVNHVRYERRDRNRLIPILKATIHHDTRQDLFTGTPKGDGLFAQLGTIAREEGPTIVDRAIMWMFSVGILREETIGKPVEVLPMRWENRQGSFVVACRTEDFPRKRKYFKRNTTDSNCHSVQEGQAAVEANQFEVNGASGDATS